MDGRLFLKLDELDSEMMHLYVQYTPKFTGAKQVTMLAASIHIDSFANTLDTMISEKFKESDEVDIEIKIKER
jgi:hypothetical protein